MADLEGSSWIDINAPIARCFDIIADVDRAPKWQGVMQDAHALEYDGRGRPVLVETHIHAIVATYSLEIGLNRTLGLLRKGVRGPAEAKVRELLARRPVEGLKREAER